MLTLTCFLRFRDGEVVTGRLKAGCKTQDVAVAYSGPAKRLPITPRQASAIELVAYFKSFARELNAQFTQEEKDDQVVVVQELDKLLEGLDALVHCPRKARRSSPGRNGHTGH